MLVVILFLTLDLVKQTFTQASPSVVPRHLPPPTPPLSSMATTPTVANGCAPSFLFFSSALHIKAAESQQTGDDVLKVLPAIQLWSALHLCAATITGFAQRCVCGVSTAGSVLVHGGSFLKSLTPCRGNAAPWKLLMKLNLLASPWLRWCRGGPESVLLA